MPGQQGEKFAVLLLANGLHHRQLALVGDLRLGLMDCKVQGSKCVEEVVAAFVNAIWGSLAASDTERVFSFCPSFSF